MDNICDPDEPKATCVIRQAMYALLAGAALFALVVAFAVEIAAVTPGIQRGADRMLSAGNAGALTCARVLAASRRVPA